MLGVGGYSVRGCNVKNATSYACASPALEANASPGTGRPTAPLQRPSCAAHAPRTAACYVRLGVVILGFRVLMLRFERCSVMGLQLPCLTHLLKLFPLNFAVRPARDTAHPTVYEV